MLTGLKILSLASKCVFYRPEHDVKRYPIELNFEGLQIQK